MIKDYLKIPVREIKRKRVRSWLTLIGIFIGIAAIISLITLGQGLENAINKQFDALGKDKLFISAKGNPFAPGMDTTVKITDDDLEVVTKTSGVKRTTGYIFTVGKIEFNDIVRYPYVSGMSTDPEERELLGEAQSFKIESGRSLRKGDKYKVVLGYEYTQPSFLEKPAELGSKIEIQGQTFKVVGLLEKIGSPPDDQMAMVPLDTYRELFDAGNSLGMIIAQTQAGDDPVKVAEDIEKELRNSRRLKEGEEDFTIQTPEQLAASFGDILDMVQIILIGIAAISLLVGGVGIMNTMYTAVLERTKEIGIIKALGAKNSQVMVLFLVESGLYGLGGGLIGAIVGIGFAKLTELVFAVFVGPAFLDIQIDWILVMGTLAFSFLVGCLSGIAPARSASKQKPVDSLRYE